MRTKKYLITSIVKSNIAGFIFKSEDNSVFHFTAIETKAILEGFDDEYGRHARYDLFTAIKGKLPFILTVPVSSSDSESDDNIENVKLFDVTLTIVDVSFEPTNRLFLETDNGEIITLDRSIINQMIGGGDHLALKGIKMLLPLEICLRKKK